MQRWLQSDCAAKYAMSHPSHEKSELGLFARPGFVSCLHMRSKTATHREHTRVCIGRFSIRLSCVVQPDLFYGDLFHHIVTLMCESSESELRGTKKRSEIIRQKWLGKTAQWNNEPVTFPLSTKGTRKYESGYEEIDGIGD